MANTAQFPKKFAVHPGKSGVINFRTVDEPSIPPTPPSCSDCATKTQAAGGSPPTQSVSRIWRSSNGNMRLDTPHTSIITIPASQKTIMLDHLKKEAMVIPMPPVSSAASPSQSPQASGAAAQHPALQVHDLGKALIEGLEVEGKRYILAQEQKAATKLQAQQTSSKPQAPPASQTPQTPNMPGMPALGIPPNLQQLAKLAPTVTEVWTSVKLGTAVLTKVKSAAGEQTTYCKPTSTDEPHPALFEIPPGYKLKKP